MTVLEEGGVSGFDEGRSARSKADHPRQTDQTRPQPASAEPVEVRPAEARHLAGIVRCHEAAFPGQFLTRLGPRVLAEYYRFYLHAPGGINLVALDPEDRVLGFVNGGDPSLRERFVWSRVPRFAGWLVLRAVQDPFVRRRLAVHLKNFVRRLGRIVLRRSGPDSMAEEEGSDPGGVSVLLSIAVHPAATGRGIGRMLLEAFRRESRRRGCTTMTLSAHADNEPAIRLYRSCGWQESRRGPDGVYFRRSTDP